MKPLPAISKIFHLGLAFGLLAFGSLNPAHADLVWSESFHNFDGADPTGAYPSGGLTLDGSTLYGTTQYGGTNGAGTVFSVPVTGGTPTTLTSFSYETLYSPYAAPVVIGSTLYGTTQSGGSDYSGTVYSLPTTGGTPTVLANFNDTNGSSPGSALTVIGSTLYGTTQYGGTNSNGTVYSLPTTGGTPTTLANFGGSVGYNLNTGVAVKGTTLFGVTSSGGHVVYQAGAVYSVPVTGGTPSVVGTFTGPNGGHPYGDLLIVGNTIYGTTTDGGSSNYGTVFPVSAIGTNNPITTLATFTSATGQYPYSNLVLDSTGTVLYGTTTGGGDYNFGTLFSIPITGGVPTTLFSFDGTNGSSPNGDLVLSGTMLYGTTGNGGTDGDGTIFGFQTASPAVPEPTVAVILPLGSMVMAFILWRRRLGLQ